MPGPVSDSYHSVFGTNANAAEVEEGIRGPSSPLIFSTTPDLKYILYVLRHALSLQEKHFTAFKV